MKHCLITGGAGFIGSHLAEHLLSEHCSVTIIDDLSSGSIDNIQTFKDHPAFTYVIDSCQNRPLVAELVDGADEIYHLAAAVGVKMIVENTAKTIDLNYTLTEIVLEMAKKKQKPLLFTSTSEVYGKSEHLPYREEGDLLLGSSIKWRWAYACSKLLDEFMVLAAHRSTQMPVVVTRLFNTVGPRQTGRYGMVVPTFVKQALSGNPITVHGDGKQSRCFCHVKDVVPLFPLLLNNEKAHGKIINLGSDEEISILGLAKKIKEQLGSSSKIQCTPYDQVYNEGFEDMKRRVPCLEKILSFFPQKKQTSLENIIRDVSASLSHP